MARALLLPESMLMVTCVAEEPKAAEACLDGWLRVGVPVTQVGLIMSESTRQRTESTSRCGSFAKDAVLIPSMGIMAAGAIVEDLAGNRGSLIDALAGLGLERADAENVLEAVQRVAVALVAFTDDDFEAPPAVAFPRPSTLVEEPNEEEWGLERVQFLNLDGVLDAGDPTARRFCLLEVD